MGQKVKYKTHFIFADNTLNFLKKTLNKYCTVLVAQYIENKGD